MTAAARVLQPNADENYRRLIAQRAAFSLPYQQLLGHTSDPFGDLTPGAMRRSSQRHSKTPASTPAHPPRERKALTARGFVPAENLGRVLSAPLPTRGESTSGNQDRYTLQAIGTE